ncbi:MAG TPA: uroporphyrinogen decarboxylase family protein [Clostridiales bacterium]|nr:uroporphyrinogen decarboxylase family protein [Clostridiales bacterium]
MDRKTMVSVERVRAAINHQEPDRIPLDLGSTKMTGISIKAYKNFIKYKGWQELDENPEILDQVQQLALVREGVLEKLGVDTRGLIPSAPSNCKTEYREVGDYIEFTDEWGVGWKKPITGGYYFDMTSHSMSGEMNLSQLDDFTWPDPLDETRTAQFPTRIEEIKKHGDYAFLMHGVSAGILEMALRLRGFEQFFMDLILDPGLVCGILDRLVEIKMAYWGKALEKVEKDVLVAIEADDLGTQNSLLISPDMYRKFVKPRHKELFSFIKDKVPGIKVFLHSCGAIKPLIPDLIEAGVDILNPVQVSASNMNTKDLKKEFGDVLTFWGGGIDTQKVLPFGSPDQVKEEVKRRIDDLAPGGGFVFSTIHNIQADVPPQNIEAMFEVLEQCGIY